MNLREYFDIGLTAAAYTQLLNDDQTDLHKLYERRASIDSTHVEAIKAAGPHNILIVTEPWCGDSLAIFPVVTKFLTAAGFPIRIILRDEHPHLIDRFLTNGGRAIPIVIVADAEFEERFHWGPRPAEAQAMVTESKAAIEAGETDKAEVHKLVRGFYARNCGAAVVSELAAKFADSRIERAVD